MAKKLKKYLDSPIVLAIAYIVIGILLCVKKAAVIEWIMIIAGALFIVQGLIDWLENKDFKEGVIEIVIGVLLIVLRFIIPQVVAIVLGALLIFNGVIKILTLPKSVAVIAYNIVTIIIGAMLIIGNWVLADILFVIIGIAFIINGVLTFFGKTK